MKHIIITNAAYCLECKTLIESKHRHDFVRCECGNLAVDGGKDYIKRSFGTYLWENKNTWIEVPDECYEKRHVFKSVNSNQYTCLDCSVIYEVKNG